MVETLRKCILRRVWLNSQGYDKYGVYFGIGLPLYEYQVNDGDSLNNIRAYNRDDAKDKIRQKHPNVQFYR